MSGSRRGALKEAASCASNGRCREGVWVVPCLGDGCAWKARNAPEASLDVIVVFRGSKAGEMNRCSYATWMIPLWTVL